MDSDRCQPDTSLPSAIILRPLFTLLAFLSLSGPLILHAQPAFPPRPPQPVPLFYRNSPGFAPGQNNLSNSPYFFSQSAFNDATPPASRPPTELRLTYPPVSTVTPRFPNRIRFSQSALEPEVPTESVSNVSEAVVIPPSSGQMSAEVDDGERANRTALLNMSSRLLMREGMRDVLEGRDRPVSGEVVPAVVVQPQKRVDNGEDVLNAQSTGNNENGASVGNITVGALIGIIAGILTLLALATVTGIVCYRRRHPTWNAAETDLRVLASHYGSYWDDKTLPNYQFNDRMTWPGDAHEEMIALDNDAFLKSLEDLGRVSSRPSSKSNWSTPDRNREREANQTNSNNPTSSVSRPERTHRLHTHAHIHTAGNNQSTKV